MTVTTDDISVETFISLSVLLTGIAQEQLAPDLDAHNLSQVYYDYAMARDPADFTQLLQIYSDNQDKEPAVIADIIFNQSGEAVCFIARSTMLMWYLGSWYSPAALQAYQPAIPAPPPPPSNVISPGAYTQGWAWNVAQAHPMGYSNFRFGYWNGNPPPLSAFVGGNGA